jgi:aminomethyltransferase
MNETNQKKTALYDTHHHLGAKLIPFAGFRMPVQYKGIISEHRRVRETAGVFDVSHMGEFEFRGSEAEAFLNWITINNVAKLNIGQVQYSAMCYPDGGIVDDLLVYRFEDRFMLVVNAANLDKDRQWIEEHLPVRGVEFSDRSDEVTLLALQGPRSLDILKSIVPQDLPSVKYYHFIEGSIAGVEGVISRTGYTGELGYEIYIDRTRSEDLWSALFDAGKPYDVEPVGLGARDTLRLEMKFCLYGNDIDATTNPLEAGLGWITKLRKDDFIGRDAIVKARDDGIERALIGYETLDRTIPRQGYPLYTNDVEVGVTTSGNHSPMLKCGIGMGYVPVALGEPGTELQLILRGEKHPIRVVPTPFYTPDQTM